MGTARVHYLASNDTTWTPPAVVSLDTETQVIQPDPEVQALRCWHVRADYRAGGRLLPGAHAEGGGSTAADLARRLHRWATQWAETWVYAHNLNFDLAVTRLPLLLTQHGWVTADMAVDSNSPWMIMRHGTRKLVIADSYTLWPVKLEEIGHALQLSKPPLPADDDPGHWMARCAADTLILHTALLQLMTYHDQHQLGRWAVTGAACSWNTMRHLQQARTGKQARAARTAQHLPAVDPAAQPMVIDTSVDAVTHDRQAIYGGRRQTWRHGSLPAGSYCELDIQRAYQTVMATQPLPRKRGRWFDSLPLDSPLIGDPYGRWGIIAECDLHTDEARWPCRVNVTPHELPPGASRDITGMPLSSSSRVIYPVGQFRTVLAGPDIAEAKRLGCLRAVRRGQVHQLGYAIRPWASWSLTAQDNPGTPDIVRLALKHQGRAVAGKWAQRSWDKQLIGASTTYGWSYQDAWVHHAKVRGAIVDMAGSKFLSWPGGDGDNCYPAVLAWIESYTRVALSRVISHLGDPAMVQCDTDGLIINAGRLPVASAGGDAGTRGHTSADAGITQAVIGTASLTAPMVLRHKTTYRTLEVLGPQHLTMDGRRRWSGIPGSAQRQPDGSYQAGTWPKLAWQMSHGDPRGYTRTVQTYRLAASYAPGWLLADGTVTAPETSISAAGETIIVPWPQTRYAARGDQPAEHQPALLTPYTECHAPVSHPDSSQ